MAPLPAADHVTALIGRIKAVGKEGAGNPAAAGAWQALRHLWKRDPRSDLQSYVCVHQGIIFGVMVLVTGSKFFTGPPFSGALLVPASLSGAINAVTDIAPGLLEYTNRSDWPASWPVFRSHFPIRANFGQDPVHPIGIRIIEKMRHEFVCARLTERVGDELRSEC